MTTDIVTVDVFPESWPYVDRRAWDGECAVRDLGLPGHFVDRLADLDKEPRADPEA